MCCLTVTPIQPPLLPSKESASYFSSEHAGLYECDAGWTTDRFMLTNVDWRSSMKYDARSLYSVEIPRTSFMIAGSIICGNTVRDDASCPLRNVHRDKHIHALESDVQKSHFKSAR